MARTTMPYKAHERSNCHASRESVRIGGPGVDGDRLRINPSAYELQSKIDFNGQVVRDRTFILEALRTPQPVSIISIMNTCPKNDYPGKASTTASC
jgi:hypothetical protein